MNNLSRLLMSSALCTVCTVASAQQVNVNGIVKDADDLSSGNAETLISSAIAGLNADVIKILFPDSEILFCDTTKDCFTDVAPSNLSSVGSNFVLK